ncbi:MAG TPA: hypothetical protein VKZ41_13750 [Gemmatimonadales bacterium]|nr:hypothetical protein [Gemmatimonadales bacterium]
MFVGTRAETPVMLAVPAVPVVLAMLASVVLAMLMSVVLAMLAMPVAPVMPGGRLGPRLSSGWPHWLTSMPFQ